MIAAVVLASGFSRRLGQSKLTLEVGGRTLLERALDAVTGAEVLGRRLVVLQPDDLALLDRARYPALEPLANPSAAEGQSASIRLATAQLAADPEVEAVIFSVADQPFLQPEVFATLTQAWRDGAGEILVSSYEGRRGNPVLFARRFFPELQALQGDVGGREVLRAHPEAVHEVPMPDPAAGQDVDTWEDLQAARELVSSPPEGEGEDGLNESPPPLRGRVREGGDASTTSRLVVAGDTPPPNLPPQGGEGQKSAPSTQGETS